MGEFKTVRQFQSSDRNVSKFVFEKDDIAVEAVLYRYGEYRKRTVICCSTQCGCPVGCTFCGTGKFFVRNLDVCEIVTQVKEVLKTIDCRTDEIEKFQIMFMSMGEPFLNYSYLHLAIRILNVDYPNAQLLVSTSAPAKIRDNFMPFVNLSMDIDKVGIQFSVHESTDEARAKLIRSGTSTLRQIASLGNLWASYTGRKPFYNYCVHLGNANVEDAARLIDLFDPKVWETTLSVICQKDESVKSSIDRQLELIRGFEKKLVDRGASVRVFNPAGQDDIGSGCGQLWYFQKWLQFRKGE